LAGLFGEFGYGLDASHEQRLDEILLGREPPVHGADPDPGVPGDVVQADLQAALVEDLHGRFQDALPVPFRVPSQRPRRASRLHLISGSRLAGSLF
jgi:hypothetical protein